MHPTPANASPTLLRTNFFRDGYIYIPYLLPPSQITQARNIILEDMISNNFTNTDGDIPSGDPPPQPKLLNRQDLCQNPILKSVLESDVLHHIVSTIFGYADRDGFVDPNTNTEKGNIIPIPYKWLRAVGKTQYTGPHVDRVYFPFPLITSWIPLGDIPTQMGSLCVIPQSHSDPLFDTLHTTYGATKVGKDGTTSGWICEDDWEEKYNIRKDDILSRSVTTDFQMGDVVFLGRDTVHWTRGNDTGRWRVSCETRWVRL